MICPKMLFCFNTGNLKIYHFMMVYNKIFKYTGWTQDYL